MRASTRYVCMGVRAYARVFFVCLSIRHMNLPSYNEIILCLQIIAPTTSYHSDAKITCISQYQHRFVSNDNILSNSHILCISVIHQSASYDKLQNINAFNQTKTNTKMDIVILETRFAVFVSIKKH